MTPEKLSVIQSDLDHGLSVYRAALNHEISETAINYHTCTVSKHMYQEWQFEKKTLRRMM